MGLGASAPGYHPNELLQCIERVVALDESVLIVVT